MNAPQVCICLPAGCGRRSQLIQDAGVRFGTPLTAALALTQTLALSATALGAETDMTPGSRSFLFDIAMHLA